jgi:hypothetical protein
MRADRAKRSVKPSAWPTLVRTQHLPPPAETARGLRIPGPAGRLAVVPLCVIMCRCESLHGSGRVAGAHCCGPRPLTTRRATCRGTGLKQAAWAGRLCFLRCRSGCGAVWVTGVAVSVHEAGVVIAGVAVRGVHGDRLAGDRGARMTRNQVSRWVGESGGWPACRSRSPQRGHRPRWARMARWADGASGGAWRW